MNREKVAPREGSDANRSPGAGEEADELFKHRGVATAGDRAMRMNAVVRHADPCDAALARRAAAAR